MAASPLLSYTGETNTTSFPHLRSIDESKSVGTLLPLVSPEGVHLQAYSSVYTLAYQGQLDPLALHLLLSEAKRSRQNMPSELRTAQWSSQHGPRRV